MLHRPTDSPARDRRVGPRARQRHSGTAMSSYPGTAKMFPGAQTGHSNRRKDDNDARFPPESRTQRVTEGRSDLADVDTAGDRRFVLPVNLSQRQVDHIMGYRRVCEVDFDDLQFLYTTSLNKPVMVENRVFPAVVVRIWSRASGKYVRILEKSAALYGRSVFGSTGHFKMLFVEPTVVMLQSTSNTQQFVTLRDHKFVGTGHGGMDGELVVRQGGDGYCTFESRACPGHFLGVRRNGNIVHPTKIGPGDLEAQFVVQKEALDICKLGSKFDW